MIHQERKEKMSEIDLKGFIEEDIKLSLFEEPFYIPVDLPPKPFFALTDFLDKHNDGKISEEFLNDAKKFMIDLIVDTNPGADREKLEKSLQTTAVTSFMNSYVEILMDKGILKNLKSRKATPAQETTAQ